MSTPDSVERLLRLAGRRESVPPERRARARTAIHDAWREHLRARSRRRRVWLAAVVGAAAVLAVVWIAGPRPVAPPVEAARVEVTQGGGPRRVGDRLAVGDEIVTAGDRLSLRLVSGASVRVDRESRVRLQSTHALELERGAVYAVSAPGSTPLEVYTPQGVVREIGTRFEVRLAGGGLRVRVREGLTVLAAASGRHEAGPGMEILSRGGAPPSMRPVAIAGAEWAWTLALAPAFPVEGHSLSDFLAWFAAETGRSVRFRDPALSAAAPRIVLHGSVDGLTPDEALDAVLPAAGIRHHLEGDALELIAEPAR